MDDEKIDCPACGDRHYGEYRSIAGEPSAIEQGVVRDDPALRLCSGCCDIAANAYSLKHGGVPFTWRGGSRDLVTLRPERESTPEKLRWEVFERDGFACRRCGSRRMLRADHVKAWIKGGPTTLENLQTLCLSCNSSKGARDV